MNLINTAVDAPQGFSGITSEPLLFILFAMLLLFGANSLWGTVQKLIEKYKSKRDSTMDERKLDFEIDKFSVETLQKAIITLNEDQKVMRKDLTDTRNELALERQARINTENKNSAMFRYIAKSVSRRRLEGIELVPVDVADHPLIPEVVDLLR